MYSHGGGAAAAAATPAAHRAAIGPAAAVGSSVSTAADALARSGLPSSYDKGPYTLLDVTSTPVPLKLTWARDAVYPAAICLRKEIKVLDLISFQAKADLTLPDRRLICGFSCKDTIFHGRLSVNVPARMIEYRKKFQLPNGSGLAVSAGLQHVGAWDTPSLRDQFQPMVSAQLNFGGMGNGNMVYSGDGFNIKQRIPVPVGRLTGLKYPTFDLKTFTTLKIPQLTTRYSLQRDGMRIGRPGSIGDGEEREALHLHVAAANFIIRL